MTSLSFSSVHHLLFLSLYLLLSQVSRLEKLAEQYGVTISFSPKFHCECNAIEGVWAHQKQYVRKHSDQTFPTMVSLIHESRRNFVDRNVAIKLIRRFWRTLKAYDNSDSYEEVLTYFFSSMCKGEVQNHRRITNSKLHDDDDDNSS